MYYLLAVEKPRPTFRRRIELSRENANADKRKKSWPQPVEEPRRDKRKCVSVEKTVLSVASCAGVRSPDREYARGDHQHTHTPTCGDPVCATLRWETRSRNLKYLQRVLPFPQQRSTGDSDSGHTCFLRVVRTRKERRRAEKTSTTARNHNRKEGTLHPEPPECLKERTNERTNKQTNKQTTNYQPT